MPKQLTAEQMQARENKRLATLKAKKDKAKQYVVLANGKKKGVVATYHTGVKAPASRVAYAEGRFWVWGDVARIDTENGLYFLNLDLVTI